MKERWDNKLTNKLDNEKIIKMSDSQIEEINKKFNEIYRELSKKINKKKFKKILNKEKIHLTNNDTNKQKPEVFTQQFLIEKILYSILEYNQDELTRENIEEIQNAEGQRFKAPDYEFIINDEKILFEAETIGSDLNKPKSGINQVQDWLNYKSINSNIGVATNGLEWVLLYFDEIDKKVKTVQSIDLRPIFNLFFYKTSIDSETEKNIPILINKFYWYFSSATILNAIKEHIQFKLKKKETITKEFYDIFIEKIFGEKNTQNESTQSSLINNIVAPENTTELDKKKFVIILMNRLIFIKFLEDKNIIKKGFLKNILRDFKNSQIPDTLYNAYFKKLFYDVFNKKIKNENLPDIYKKIPYLNGGLFRENVNREIEYNIENNEILEEIINFLEEYDFTVSEKENNNKKEINPDILGYIYENTVNKLTSGGKKELGAYYTPDYITMYIVEKTLEQYILKKFNTILKNYGLNEELKKIDDINKFIIPKDALENLLDEINSLKILDPAVGSGHFLISALKYLSNIKLRIYKYLDLEINLFKIKREIIINNLYGVDIDGTAIELAKLRLWLSLIEEVEKKEDIDILPNIEYNIVQGNSLIGYIDINTIKTIFTSDYEEINNKLENLKQKIKNYKTNSNINENERLKKEIEKELNEIKNKINESFKTKYNIDCLDANTEIMFHWPIEFYEIFLKSNDNGFDIIISNPPYGNLLTPTEKKIIDYSDNKNEIADVFLNRCIKLNKNGGYLSFIMTFAITFSKDFSKTRLNLKNKYEKTEIYTFDRDKCYIFNDMSQSVSIIVAINKNENNNGNIFTSRFLRSLPEDLKKINVQFSNNWLLTENGFSSKFEEKHRLPKIGDEIILKILSKLKNYNLKLKDIILDNKDEGNKVWIRISGNYWYNAWDWKPYNSSQIQPITIKRDMENFFIVVINSNLFYLFMRVYGDGRHLNSDILKQFPIPVNSVIENYKEDLSQAKNELMECLKNNFDKERNRFITNKCKEKIDNCDKILQNIYNLTSEELNYIINYDLEIRNQNAKNINDSNIE
ncbi:MAG: Eco57I restriction-modification methylase domain-containing protein [Minisyncoccia bacterium]